MDEGIAVVGIGCNFPGGEGLDKFWQVLVKGQNCTVDIPQERFDCTSWFDPDGSQPGKTQTTRAALIDGFNELDHKFFGISEAEADQMDPQHKLLLQCSYRALENAGIPMEKISGTRTGVYIGLMNRDYEALLNNNVDRITHYNSTGTAMSVAANRISFTFNLTGPSFALDSACSSSLVALHIACQAIRQGDCDMALCGGVSCILDPRVFVALNKARMISPDGSSKPFSSRADGYGRGEGCGVVLLKPLQKALQDSDHIWGVISKTAVNQDGRTVSPITKPSKVQQEELLSRIYSTETDLMGVQYIEAHGTGTPVGDPIEASSISKVIAKARPPGAETLIIGSVKSNIGHTESAAGVAGLIKVLLMMKHETIVPLVFYSEEEASIDAKVLNIKIPSKLEKWTKGNFSVRTAGVNNFGFGGTNVHAIIKEYKQMPKSKVVSKDTQTLFVLSAMTGSSLHMCISDMCNTLSGDEHVDLNDVAYTSACRRSHARHKHRKAFKTSSIAELKDQLRVALNGSTDPYKPDLKLVFVFCGSGVTYQGMCEQLVKEEPVFREKLKEVESLLKNQLSDATPHKDLSDLGNDISRADVAQPLLFAFQVALVSLLRHWGIRPDVVVGHSVGEVAAAHCSGLLSLADAVKVIRCRSTLQATVAGGTMLVVGNVPVADVAKIISPYSGKVCLAAINSPVSSVLSGQRDAIESVWQRLRSFVVTKNLFLHILDVPAAYHSHMMDPILNQIKDGIGRLSANEVVCELYSTVTGNCASVGDFTTGEYWARNIREPVAFQQAVESAVKGKANTVFIEISPKRTLQRNLIELLGNGTTVLSTVQPDNSTQTLASTLAKLFELGCPIDWHNVYTGYECPPLAFPRYQFNCVRKDIHFLSVRQDQDFMSHSAHPLLTQSEANVKQYKCNLLSNMASYLWEHKSNGTAILPGSLYVELAFEAAMQFIRPMKPLCCLQLSVSFQNICVLRKDSDELKVHLESMDGKITFEIWSVSTMFACGKVTCGMGPVTPEVAVIDCDIVSKRCPVFVTKDEVYSHLSLAGFEYGASFKQLDNIHYGGEFMEALTTIVVPDELLDQMHEYRLSPVVLDWFIQMASVMNHDGGLMRPCFPSAIGNVLVSRPLQRVMVMYQRVTQVTHDYFEVCGCLADPEGRVLVEVKQLRISFVQSSPQTVDFLHSELHAMTQNTSVVTRPKVLLFEDNLGVAKALRPYLHPQSASVSLSDVSTSGVNSINHCLESKAGLELTEALFLWGIEDLSPLKIDTVLDKLVECCEVYRQTALWLGQLSSSGVIRVITYRSSGNTADHISPGFVLPGMTRALAAEMEGLSFQWLDLASVSAENVRVLANIVSSHPSKQHPEIVISKGQAYFSTIARSQLHDSRNTNKSFNDLPSQKLTLVTTNPYVMHELSTIRVSPEEESLLDKDIEVYLEKVCVHSSDYFPISGSELRFGQTIYWSKLSSQYHQVLALDFGGTVTAVGKGVKRLQVGDRVVSCYPTVASSYVRVPEDVCFSTSKLPFLRDVPCVSYLVLAKEVFGVILAKDKMRKVATVFSTAPKFLAKIFVEIGRVAGWSVNIRTDTNSGNTNCAVAILLPPYDQSLFSNVTRLSSVKQIIVICKEKFTSQSKLIKHSNHNAHVHVLETIDVFQRAYCQTQGPRLNHWLHEMDHVKISQIFRQNIMSAEFSLEGAMANQPSHSYFNVEKMPLIVFAEANSLCGLSRSPTLPQANVFFQQNCVYIVSGGLTGLGFETVRFIAQRGGGHIVTLSRSSPSDENKHRVNALQQQCRVTVLTLQCDVSSVKDVLKAFIAITERFPHCPVKGLFHSAAVLHDGLIETLDRSDFKKVLKPKVSGALNLHFATLHCKLDYFVCYSSISSFLGNASQANYAAANSFLDAFCQYRRNLGLAGQSINWGPLNLGLLLNKVHFQKFLEAKGLTVMDITDFHQTLERCLLTNNIQQVVCKLNFRNLQRHIFSQNASLRARLTPLVQEKLKMREQETEPLAQSVCTVEDYVKSLLCDLSNADMADLKDCSALSSLGIDSMSAMTMQNRIFQEKAITVPLVTLLDPKSTLSSLVVILKQNSYVDMPHK